MNHLLLILSLFICTHSYCQYDFTRLDRVLSEKQPVLGGKVSMLIYRDGKVVYQKHLGGYTSETIEPIASCSKWITAAMVMSLVEEGKISLEDTIGKYLPLFTRYKKGKIKIRHCLSHTTGIQGENITLATITGRNKFNSLEEEVNDFAQRPVAAVPGEQFFYGNMGINIAGRILEVVSGKDFETLFQERIGKPLGMANTTFKGRQAVNPSGSAFSTAADYMNFLIMILDKGMYRGKRILKESSIAAMQQSHTEDVKVSYVPDQTEDMEYGLGEWILEKDEVDNTSVVGSPGLFGTFPYVDLDNGYAAIVFIKTFKFKERNATYKAIKEAADQCLTR